MRRRPGPQPEGLPAPFLVERLRASPELQARATAARSLGISLKRFDGWEPRTYSWREKRGGRMVTVTERDTEWDSDEQDWMLALALLDADECPGCHGWLSETTKPENENTWSPAPPLRCHRCTAQGIGADQVRDSPNPQKQALFIQVNDRRDEEAAWLSGQ